MLTFFHHICIITIVPSDSNKSKGTTRNAEVAELADALDSKSSEFPLVPVRVRPSAPANNAVHREMNRFFVFYENETDSFFDSQNFLLSTFKLMQ